MNRNIENHYRGERISLDGNYYQDCTFQNCVLEFGGTAEVGLVNNRIIDCQWSFVGPAANTIGFLRALNNGLGPTGHELIQQLLGSTRLDGVAMPNVQSA